MPLNQCYTFAGTDLATKFAWVNGTPGMNAVTPAADGLRGLGDTLTRATEDAQSRMKGLGASWTGPAATAAQNSLTRTADGASETAVVTTNGADRLVEYGDSFEWLRTQIAFVDPARFSLAQRAGDNISEAWQSLWGEGTDHVTISEMNAGNDERANHALQMHHVNTARADNGFTTTTAAAAHPTGDGAGPQPGGAGGSASPAHVGQAGAAPAGGAGQAGPAPTSTATAPGSAAHGGGVTAVPAPSGAGGVGGAGGGRQRGVGTSPGGAPTGAGGVTGPGRGAGWPGQGGGASPGTGLPKTATAQAPGATPSASAPGFGQTANAPSAGTGRASPWAGGGIAGPDDAAARRSGLGNSFGRDLAAGGPAAPRSGIGGSGGGGRGWGGSGTQLGWGPEAGGRSAVGGGSEPGGRAPGAERGWSRGAGEGVAGRGALGEPAATGRSTAGSAYGPMVGGAGAGAGQGGQEHRNRYLIPTDEAFDIDLDYTAPVLGPLPDERD